MKTLAWLVVWAVIAGVGIVFIQKRAVGVGGLHQPVDTLLWKQREEMSALEQELKRGTREAAARRKGEIERAWGEPLAAAFKNPEYSLRDALRRAAEVCAPTNTLIGVEVDRFTEFTVTFESTSAISTNDMIATARRLMPVAKEYLDALRFSVRGKLVAEIDRSDIEFIQDWERAPEQRIAALLPRESQSRIVEDAAAIERLRDEQRISQALAAEPGLRDKAERADQNLRQAIQDGYAELTSAFESTRRALVLHELRSLRGLDEREKQLRAAAEHADRAEKFWMNPAKEWERVLEAEGISGELREVLVKSFPAIYRYNAERTAKVFEALRAEIASVRLLLQMLTTGADKWRFSGEGIVFREEAFARRFEDGQRQFREDTQATEAALREWREAVGP